MALVYFRSGKKLDLGSYSTARFSRIYPVYILAFAVTCLYYLDLMARMKSPKIWANIFLYQSWIPTYSQSFNMAAWSLSVEAFFYILFPFLVIWLARVPPRRIIWLSIGFWVVSQIVHSTMYVTMMPDAHLLLGYFPLFHLSAFLLGLGGGIWFVTRPSELTVNQSVNRVLLFVALGLVSAALIGRQLAPRLFRSLSLDVGSLAPLFLVIILTLALDQGSLSRWLSHPWLVRLGDASYALYILHVPVRWWIERTLAATGASVSFATMYYFYLPFMIALSVLVFVWIERPAQNWLRHNMNRLPLMAFDLLLIAAAVWISFALRLGSASADFEHARLFAFRTAPLAYFGALLVFGVYGTGRPYWGRLLSAILLGAGTLSLLMYYAWTQDWVEGFSRAVLLLNAGLTIVLIPASRILLELWRPRLPIAEEQA
jgi:peptidoglycan/LPS O-acetylase OafA/YrhL